MAIYLVDRASRIPSIKAALQAAGVLVTTHFENTADLVVTTTRSNKVIRLTSDGRVFLGTAWTSGTNITDSRSVDNPSSGGGDPFDWATIVTPDVLAFVYKTGIGATGRCGSSIFVTTVSGTHLALGSTTDATTFSDTWCYETDTVTLAPFIVPITQFANGLLVDNNGFFFTTDMYFKYLTNNQPILSPAKGIKAVLNGFNDTQGFFKHGNDIVVTGWRTNDNGNPMQANIIIPNGMV